MAYFGAALAASHSPGGQRDDDGDGPFGDRGADPAGDVGTGAPTTLIHSYQAATTGVYTFYVGLTSGTVTVRATTG
jgi:hypothetical protein